MGAWPFEPSIGNCEAGCGLGADCVSCLGACGLGIGG